MRDGRLHQTTVRFSPDLWEALEAECSRLGMSAAQYLREAALARLAYTAGQRGDRDYAEAFEVAGVAVGSAGSVDADTASTATTTGREKVMEASAVYAQSQIARRRAREVRERAAELRRLRREKVK